MAAKLIGEMQQPMELWTQLLFAECCCKQSKKAFDRCKQQDICDATPCNAGNAFDHIRKGQERPAGLRAASEGKQLEGNPAREHRHKAQPIRGLAAKRFRGIVALSTPRVEHFVQARGLDAFWPHPLQHECFQHIVKVSEVGSCTQQ